MLLKERNSCKRREMAAESCKSDETQRGTLLSYDELPEWYRRDNNQWILHHYRHISNSVGASFRSWCYLHNETINIYSHLVPAIIFLFGEWRISQHLTASHPEVTNADLVALSMFMLPATVCYTFSALYHTLMNHSCAMNQFCHRLDMLGIGIFIVGDIVLGIYLIFWCETTPRNLYWFMVSQSSLPVLFLLQDQSAIKADIVFVRQQIGLFGAFTIITNVGLNLQSHEYRTLRTLAFVATGTSVMAPLIHGLYMFGLDSMNKKAFTHTLVAKIGCLLPGTVLYAVSPRF
jgi:adiponectin receptor